MTRLLAVLGAAIAVAAIAVTAAVSSGDGRTVLKFDTMAPVVPPYTGATNPIRGVNGGGLPWKLDSAHGRLRADGRLKIERQALMREDDPVSRDRLARVEKEIADLKEKSGAMKAKWQSEKEEIEKMRKGKEHLEDAKLELERARQAGDLNKAAELQYGRIPELEKLLSAEQQRLSDLQKDGVFLKEEVDEEDVAQVVGGLVRGPLHVDLIVGLSDTREDLLTQRIELLVVARSGEPALARQRGVTGLHEVPLGLLGVVEGQLTRADLAGDIALQGSQGVLPQMFWAVAANTGDAITVPAGYKHAVFCRWGDPLFADSPVWKGDASEDAAAQMLQIGDNHDGMHFFPLTEGNSTEGLLVMNHEYINDEYFFTPDVQSGATPWSIDHVRKGQHAHGVSVIHVKLVNGSRATLLRLGPTRVAPTTALMADLKALLGPSAVAG